MSEQPLSTAENVKAHADVMELQAIAFLDSSGKYAQTMDLCTEVRLTFIDATTFRLAPAEFEKLSDYKFRLRPSENDA